MKIKKPILLSMIIFMLPFTSCDKTNSTTQQKNIKTTQQKDDLGKQPESSPTIHSKKAPTLQPEISQNTLQIIENDKFLKSAEGIDFQVKAWKLTKAYFNQDKKYIKTNSKDIQNEITCFASKIDFSDITMVFRFGQYDNKNKTASAGYTVYFDDENKLTTYLDFEMIIDHGEWKIIWYGTDV